jgi:probable HAF family extracellular repeat protein
MVALSHTGGYSHARDITPDGSVIAGYDSSSEGATAWRWTESGIVYLGDLPGGGDYSDAQAVSANGLVVVGSSSSSSGPQAFRWTSQTGMVGLGALPGGEFRSYAYGASGDGATIVGSSGHWQTPQAFIWDADNGMRRLDDVLTEDLGLDLTGWTLGIARDISDDGRTIVGYGTNPGGGTEAWMAHIPEPTTLGLFVLVGLAVLRHRRCSRDPAR